MHWVEASFLLLDFHTIVLDCVVQVIFSCGPDAAAVHTPYSWKIWRRISFGRLVDARTITKLNFNAGLCQPPNLAGKLTPAMGGNTAARIQHWTLYYVVGNVSVATKEGCHREAISVTKKAAIWKPQH